MKKTYKKSAVKVISAVVMCGTCCTANTYKTQ
jgi:hypothetical protein